VLGELTGIKDYEAVRREARIEFYEELVLEYKEIARLTAGGDRDADA